MTNEPSYQPHSDKVCVINAVCLTACGQYAFKNGTRHIVNFINHGDDRKTGLNIMSKYVEIKEH